MIAMTTEVLVRYRDGAVQLTGWGAFLVLILIVLLFIIAVALLFLWEEERSR